MPITFTSAVTRRNIHSLEYLYQIDGIVCVHDLNSPNFQQLCQLQKTKGASLFTLDVQCAKSLTGEKNIVVRLGVAVKRKLQLYYLKNRKFEEFNNDVELGVSELLRALSW